MTMTHKIYITITHPLADNDSPINTDSDDGDYSSDDDVSIESSPAVTSSTAAVKQSHDPSSRLGCSSGGGVQMFAGFEDGSSRSEVTISGKKRRRGDAANKLSGEKLKLVKREEVSLVVSGLLLVWYWLFWFNYDCIWLILVIYNYFWLTFRLLLA